MDNTWYYTLSTIAQALASILGLAAVFATIRLQNITNELKEYRRISYYVIKSIEEHITIDALNDRRITEITANGLRDILDGIKKDYQKKYIKNSGIRSDLANLARTFYPNIKLDNKKFVEDTVYYLKFYIKQRDNLVKTVKFPGILTSFTIIYAVFLLLISDFFYCNNIFDVLFLISAVIFSFFSILLIINASWKLLKDAVEKI